MTINTTVEIVNATYYNFSHINKLPTDEEVIEMAIGHIRNDISLLSAFLYGSVIVLCALVVYNNYLQLRKDGIRFLSLQNVKRYGFDYLLVLVFLGIAHFAFSGIKTWLGL